MIVVDVGLFLNLNWIHQFMSENGYSADYHFHDNYKFYPENNVYIKTELLLE